MVCSLPSVSLEVLGKEIFKKKMFCSLPSARLEALGKEGVQITVVKAAFLCRTPPWRLAKALPSTRHKTVGNGAFAERNLAFAEHRGLQ